MKVMKMVLKKRTCKEILNDVSLPDKFITIGIICVMVCILVINISVIAATFNEYGIVCGLLVTLFLGGAYSILIGLCVSGIGNMVDLYDAEWVEDDK